MFNALSLKAKLAIVHVAVCLLVVFGQAGVAGAMAAPVAHSPVVAAVSPAVLPPPLIPATTSFSVDASAMLDMAASIFNALWPVFGMVVGIILGIGLVTLLVTEIRKAI